jgi:DNA-binding PadR family transcriptional regulator
MISPYPFPTKTELKILAVLADNTGLYSLELVRRSGGNLKRGTVYVTLGRLQDKGLVRSRVPKKAKNPGPPRPIYSVTGKGYRMLEAAGKSPCGRS